jgi:hypothetical protein
MSAYRVEWECCGSESLTEAWEPEECPFCTEHKLRAEIERLQAEVERLRKIIRTASKDLIQVMRMPNIEHVADKHNAAIRALKEEPLNRSTDDGSASCQRHQ